MKWDCIVCVKKVRIDHLRHHLQMSFRRSDSRTDIVVLIRYCTSLMSGSVQRWIMTGTGWATDHRTIQIESRWNAPGIKRTFRCNLRRPCGNQATPSHASSSLPQTDKRVIISQTAKSLQQSVLRTLWPGPPPLWRHDPSWRIRRSHEKRRVCLLPAKKWWFIFWTCKLLATSLPRPKWKCELLKCRQTWCRTTTQKRYGQKPWDTPSCIQNTLSRAFSSKGLVVQFATVWCISEASVRHPPHVILCYMSLR